MYRFPILQKMCIQSHLRVCRWATPSSSLSATFSPRKKRSWRRDSTHSLFNHSATQKNVMRATTSHIDYIDKWVVCFGDLIK